MKVGIVVSEFPKLSETFVLNQVIGLAELGHEVSVICDVIGEDPRLDVSVEPLRSIMRRTYRRWPLPGMLQQIYDQLPDTLKYKAAAAADLVWNRQLNDCDVLLAHFGDQGLRLARAKKRGRLSPPIVTIFHGFDVGMPQSTGTLGMYQPLFRYGALHLTVNTIFRTLLIGAGAAPEAVKVHRMGIDCHEIDYHWRPAEGRPIQFISVCRLVEKKGIDSALRALAFLRRDKPDTDWHYTIVGDGPLYQDLMLLSHNLGLDDHVTFTGARPHEEVKARLADSHAFVLPSITASDGDVEGVPVSLMEAMAAGLVVISSRHSGIPELIEDRSGGFLSDENDVRSLADNIAWVAENHSACEPVTRSARKRVETDFDNNALNESLSTLLTKVAGSSVSSRNSVIKTGPALL